MITTNGQKKTKEIVKADIGTIYLEEMQREIFFFSSFEEFKEYINLNPEDLSISDQIDSLNILIKHLEKNEMYEYCSVILNKINYLKTQL